MSPVHWRLTAAYGKYLDGTLWPSESKGEIQVQDMAPQHASSALGTVKRHCEETAADAQDFEELWATFRASTLGRALIARATFHDDFTMDEERGPDTGYGPKEAAKMICHALLDVVDVDPMDAARLSMEITQRLYGRNYYIAERS